MSPYPQFNEMIEKLGRKDFAFDTADSKDGSARNELTPTNDANRQR